MKRKIAIIITCHNRKEKTLECLGSLFNNSLPVYVSISVFLVDDGSTDGTKEAVESNFPIVKVIQGSGSLYWNQGMRLAWETAASEYDFDFYLWLNDDTLLIKTAIQELYESFNHICDQDNEEPIIAGACKMGINNEGFSYGGRTESGPVIPSGLIQCCKYINGNVVLVSKKVYKRLGNLSNDYTHAMGDFDYGLRAINEGFRCYTTREYIGICPTNEISDWCNPAVPLRKRFSLFNSPLGLNYKEYIIFCKKFWGWKWILFSIKAYAKVIAPRFYSQLSRIV